jgi:2,4-dienoyl-CoA reductase-like NADH-dependent reductase (Old Yellow Enzyme family)
MDVDSPNMPAGERRHRPSFRISTLLGAYHAHGAALMVQITHLGRRGEPYAAHWLPTIGPSALRDATPQLQRKWTSTISAAW